MSRFVPIVCAVIWLPLIPALAASPVMDLWGKRIGFTIVTIVGLGILTVSLTIGFWTFLRSRKHLEKRDRMLSISLALNFVLLLGFSFFLLLVWPVILHSPRQIDDHGAKDDIQSSFPFEPYPNSPPSTNATVSKPTTNSSTHEGAK